MTSEEQLDRKVRLLLAAYKKIGAAIESHEFDYASILARELSNELDYANHLANKLADAE